MLHTKPLVLSVTHAGNTEHIQFLEAASPPPALGTRSLEEATSECLRRCQQRQQTDTMDTVHRAAGTLPTVQWLGLSAFTAGAQVRPPGWGTKSPHATQLRLKNKQTNCAAAGGRQGTGELKRHAIKITSFSSVSVGCPLPTSHWKAGPFSSEPRCSQPNSFCP